MKIHWEYQSLDNTLVCELNAADVKAAIKEYALYMKRTGKTYERDEMKVPNDQKFFELYFGEEDFDCYSGTTYHSPEKYVCTNVRVASEFFKFAQKLEYHDRYNQCFCEVKQNKNVITICYGDY